MGFKENLKSEISYQGLLVKEVASKAGLQPNTISNYLRENSSIPSADIAVKIARALNVSVEYLVTGQFENKDGTKGKVYSPEIRKLVDSIERLSEKDRNLIAVLVKELEKNQQ